ncbi:hypothetical protein AK812_SmicGene16556 [Symbiodinium microadriaticum]|uniref:Uncharacterized protein n=1 Tax=Symbiodinium microadriaticum TaxID=2951 RepID=A0A1Q9E006_SYMMI|nr:hypothetical protein AK812_SmicGene16556 [Symbiodinium microadriaticum]
MVGSKWDDGWSKWLNHVEGSYQQSWREEPGAGGHNVSDTENVGSSVCQKSAHAPSRLFPTAVNDVAKPWKPRLRHQAPDTPPTPSTALTPEPAPQTEEQSPWKYWKLWKKPPNLLWTAFPRKEDITVGTEMGRISPFSVGYACAEMGDKQPEGRAKDILLSRVWQQVKVNADAKACYSGHEFPIVVFRARAAEGREQLFTTQPWKLYCLQTAAVARRHLKPVIRLRFLLEAAEIDDILGSVQIPENFNEIRIVSPMVTGPKNTSPGRSSCVPRRDTPEATDGCCTQKVFCWAGKLSERFTPRHRENSDSIGKFVAHLNMGLAYAHLGEPEASTVNHQYALRYALQLHSLEGHLMVKPFHREIFTSRMKVLVERYVDLCGTLKQTKNQAAALKKLGILASQQDMVAGGADEKGRKNHIDETMISVDILATGQNEQSIDYFTQAIEAARAEGDQEAEKDCSVRLGIAAGQDEDGAKSVQTRRVQEKERDTDSRLHHLMEAKMADHISSILQTSMLGKPALRSRSDMHVIGSLAGFWVRRTMNTSSDVQAKHPVEEAQLTAFRSKAPSPPVSPGSAANVFTMPRPDSAGCSQCQDGVLSRNSSLSADEETVETQTQFISKSDEAKLSCHAWASEASGPVRKPTELPIPLRQRAEGGYLKWSMDAILHDSTKRSMYLAMILDNDDAHPHFSPHKASVHWQEQGVDIANFGLYEVMVIGMWSTAQLDDSSLLHY